MSKLVKRIWKVLGDDSVKDFVAYMMQRIITFSSHEKIDKHNLICNSIMTMDVDHKSSLKKESYEISLTLNIKHHIYNYRWRICKMMYGFLKEFANPKILKTRHIFNDIITNHTVMIDRYESEVIITVLFKTIDDSIFYQFPKTDFDVIELSIQDFNNILTNCGKKERTKK